MVYFGNIGMVKKARDIVASRTVFLTTAIESRARGARPSAMSCSTERSSGARAAEIALHPANMAFVSKKSQLRNLSQWIAMGCGTDTVSTAHPRLSLLRLA